VNTANPAAAQASWISGERQDHTGRGSPDTSDVPPAACTYASYAVLPSAVGENTGLLVSPIMGSMRINHGRAAARTILHGVLVAAVAIAVIAPQLGIEDMGGVVGGLVAVSVVIARVMALPAVEALLRRLGISVQDIHDELGGVDGSVGGSRSVGGDDRSSDGPDPGPWSSGPCGPR
jgi:hypothetical protein